MVVRRADDLTCGGVAIWLWCVPTALLVVSASWDSLRPWIWTAALTVMGGACLANAARCNRRHCYVTGPGLLLGALLSLLRGLSLISLSWSWTTGEIIVSAIVGFGWEMIAGQYAH